MNIVQKMQVLTTVDRSNVAELDLLVTVDCFMRRLLFRKGN